MGKNVTVKLTGVQAHAKAGRLGWTQTREYYEKRPILLSVVIAVTLGSPFLGLFLAGWIGVIAGLMIGIIAFFAGFFAITRVREEKIGE